MSELAISPLLLAPPRRVPESTQAPNPLELPRPLVRFANFVIDHTVQRLRSNSVNNRWPHTPTRLHTFSPDGSSDDRVGFSEGWVVFTGFGSADGINKAALLRQHLSDDRSVAVIDVSDRGTNDRELGTIVSTHIKERKIERFSGYGHSMGLLRLLASLEHVEVPVGRILADGSPGSLATVRFGKMIESIVPVLDRLSYKGGRGGKFAVTLLREIDQNGLPQVIHSVRRAGYETMHGSSPLQGPAELRELRGYCNLLDQSFYEGKITNDTQIGYCRAEDPRGDPVVYVDKAQEELGKFFVGRFGATLEPVLVPGSGHAQSELSIPAAARAGWFERTNDLAA